MLCAALIITGTGERTCASDGAGDAGSAEELSRGQCVCACVHVGMVVYACVYAYTYVHQKANTPQLMH